MTRFEEHIQYQFKNESLLVEALTHSSFGYENQVPYNERLEFLGDSILGYVVSTDLFTYFPNDNEGTLSKLKSVLVSARNLSKKANHLGLGEEMRFGKGEVKAGGQKKASILADAVEALIGAVAIDGGLDQAVAFVRSLYGDEIKTASLEIKNTVDFKTRLQEQLQELGIGLPNYVVTKEEGPAHQRVFRMQVHVGDYHGPTGSGSSKKNAQQECARLLLEDQKFWQVHAPVATASHAS